MDPEAEDEIQDIEEQQTEQAQQEEATPTMKLQSQQRRILLKENHLNF